MKKIFENNDALVMLYAIVDSTPDAIIISNTEGMIIFANKQAYTMFGYSKNQLEGINIDLLLPERYREQHKKMIQTKFLIDPSFRMMAMGRNVLAMRKDKTEFYVEISLSIIEINHKKQLISCALRNTDEKEKIHHALRSSEERFRLIANNSPAMIWITDTNGNARFVNKTWLDFTGLSLEDALTKNAWNNVIHPDDRKKFKKYYSLIEINDNSVTVEYRLKNKDGSWHWILDIGVTIFDEHNLFCGYMGSAIDITQRKQAEAELSIVASVFESREPMVITDTKSVILKVNKAFCESTGYKKHELVGHKINILKSGKHDANFYANMWSCLSNSGEWQGEIFDKRKNGEIYPKWLTITAIKNSSNEITHYVGSHIDITKQKAVVNEMERLAFYDQLTNLPNRRLLMNRLEHSIEINKRTGNIGAILFIDMDNFKNLNDTLGHDMGDLLLKTVGERLTNCVRKIDTVSRLGGDEFIVMLENLGVDMDLAIQKAKCIGVKILDTLNENYQLLNHNYHSTPSIGCVLFDGQEKDVNVLLKRADLAMYHSKRLGRNQLSFECCLD